MTYEEYAKDWVGFLENNRNKHPIRGIAFEQWCILQLAQLSDAVVKASRINPQPVKQPEKLKDK